MTVQPDPIAIVFDESDVTALAELLNRDKKVRLLPVTARARVLLDRKPATYSTLLPSRFGDYGQARCVARVRRALRKLDPLLAASQLSPGQRLLLRQQVALNGFAAARAWQTFKAGTHYYIFDGKGRWQNTTSRGTTVRAFLKRLRVGGEATRIDCRPPPLLPLFRTLRQLAIVMARGDRRWICGSPIKFRFGLERLLRSSDDCRGGVASLLPATGGAREYIGLVKAVVRHRQKKPRPAVFAYYTMQARPSGFERCCRLPQRGR